MRITDIEIENYRAFYGKHHLCLDKDGKNLMIYGENGCGKSSIYTALQDFLKASVVKVDLEENIFIQPSHKNTALIKVDIKESPESSKTISFKLKIADKEIISADKVLLVDANKVKGFFDYRSLLRTHIGYNDKVDVFNILVNNILYNSINRFTNKEIGLEWDEIYDDTFNKRYTVRRHKAIENYLNEKFNPGLKQLLLDIDHDTNTFMNYFGVNVKTSLEFDKVVYKGRRNLSGDHIYI